MTQTNTKNSDNKTVNLLIFYPFFFRMVGAKHKYVIRTQPSFLINVIDVTGVVTANTGIRLIGLSFTYPNNLFCAFCLALGE